MNGEGGFLDISFDDLDISYDDEDDKNVGGRSDAYGHLSLSAYSLKSSANGADRPGSMMSSSTSNGTISTSASFTPGRKPPHKVFKKETVSVYDPDTQTMDFEELIRSGNTMKVSLTPNRLRSIEIKDQLADEPATPAISWERRSTASMPRIKSSASASHITSATITATSTAVPNVENTQKKDMHLADALKGYQTRQHTLPETQQKPSPRPANLNNGATSASGSNLHGKDKQQVQQPAADKKNPPSSSHREEESSPGPNHSQNLSKQTPTPVPATSHSSKMRKSSSEQAKLPDQQPPKKEMKVLRRSSMSSKKSRENLRRQREKEEAEAAAAAAAAASTPTDPATSSNATQSSESSKLKSNVHPTTVTPKRSIESVDDERSQHPLPSPPASETSSSAELKKEEKSSGTFDNASVDSASDAEERRVRFKNKDESPARVESPVDMNSSAKDESTPERPSTIVAKRASMVGSARRRSLHETYAVDTARSDRPRERMPTAGSVESTVKAWDEMTKQGEDTIAPTVARRRSTLQPSKSEEELQKEKDGEVVSRPRTPSQRQPQRPNSVLDKVMQFERASSLDDFAQQHHRQHRASAYIPRRERFLYLQREPGVLERRTTTFTRSKPVAKDAETQTDPIPELVNASQIVKATPALVVTAEGDDGVTVRKEVDMDNFSEKSSEHVLVEGDEEWFLQDDEWEDIQDQETAVVEWLLGEA